MSVEKIIHRVNKKGTILTVEVGNEACFFQIEGALKADLNNSPVGSAILTLGEGEVTSIRVYKVEIDKIPYYQGISGPVKNSDPRKRKVRRVSGLVPVEKLPMDPEAFTKTVDHLRRTWGQRSDS